MFGLVHMIEELPIEGYLRKIAVCTPNMNDAQEWAMTLNRRILNSPDRFSEKVDYIYKKCE